MQRRPQYSVLRLRRGTRHVARWLRHDDRHTVQLAPIKLIVQNPWFPLLFCVRPSQLLQLLSLGP